MESPTGRTAALLSGLTPLLRAARLRAWWCLVVAALAAVGAAGTADRAPGASSGPASTPASASGRLTRPAERDARALLMAERGPVRVALRRGDPPLRPGLRGPEPARGTALHFRALSLLPGAAGFSAAPPSRLPARRALAAARDGTLSAASNGVPPPSPA